MICTCSGSACLEESVSMGTLEDGRLHSRRKRIGIVATVVCHS